MSEEKTQKVGLRKRLLLLFLLVAPAVVFILSATVKCEHHYERLDVLGKIPQYEAKTLNGEILTNENFQNKTVIYTTLQTTCPKECGINLWFMDQNLFKKIKGRPNVFGNVRIVSFVLNKAGKPASQKDLEDMQQILKDNVLNYDPKIWMVVSGDPEVLYNIQRNGQNLKDAGGQNFIDGKAYNSTLMLADRKGQLRMVMRGDHEGTVRTLQQYLELLFTEYKSDTKGFSTN